MWMRKVSGTYYEIGQKIGKLMREQNFKNFTGEDIPFLKNPDKLPFAKECEKAVGVHAPDLLEELQGILDGGNFTFETLGVLEVSLSAQKGCTLCAIAGEYTDNGQPMMARSYDFMDWSIQDFTGTWTHPLNKYTHLGFTDIGLGRYGGCNETGLAIATTGVVPFIGSPGVINYLASRWVLDNCHTTEKAVAYLQKIPKVWGVNFLIIDAESTIAVVESHPEKTHVSYPEGVAVVTNHYISPEMDKYQEYVHPNSVTRFNFMHEWVESKKTITIEYIKEAQRDHDHEMCAHSSHRGMTLVTCWAWIAQPTERKVYVCQGSPCQNEYELYTF
ncbi:MAG: C45 family autoproteolytic acyltransferase/hydrolase [Candidatus Methanofastidiosia archaeon]|jgi:predicted choloylglycine hydrolase